MRDLDEDPHAPRWRAVADVCNSCAEVNSAQRAAHEDNQGQNMGGWYWSTEKVNGRGLAG